MNGNPMRNESGKTRCSAKGRNGERCRSFPVKGTNVCRMHGGAAGHVKRAAKRRIAREKFTKEATKLATLGGNVEPLDDPVGEFRLAIGRAKALEDAMWEQLQGSPDETTIGAYVTQLERLTRFLESFTRLGLEAKLVAITEQQGELVAEAMMRTIEALEREVLATIPGDSPEVLRVFRDRGPVLARRYLERAATPRHVEEG
jgi:hypothetical protein